MTQTVKMNELFSPAGLASQVLFTDVMTVSNLVVYVRKEVAMNFGLKYHLRRVFFDDRQGSSDLAKV